MLKRHLLQRNKQRRLYLKRFRARRKNRRQLIHPRPTHNKDYPTLWLQHFARAVWWIERIKDGRLLGINISFKSNRVLITTKASFNGKRLVAFHSSDNLTDALAEHGYMLANRGFKWRQDKFSMGKK